jgi:diguanylate cyclase (GGDEF)-like protein
MLNKRRHEDLDDFLQLSFFADIGIGIAASKAINQAMKQVMEEIGEVFAPVTWLMLLLDRKTDEFFVKFAAGKNADKLGQKRIPGDQGIPGWVREHETGTSVTDAAQDGRISRRSASLPGYRIRSVLAVPLRLNGGIVGVVYLINRQEGGTYAESDIPTLSNILEFASETIQKVYYLSALKDMANMDALTGVYDRRHFENQLLKESERCRRYGPRLALLIVDIDGLKDINERQGPAGGDGVLKDLTRIMRGNTRRIDIIARHSGGRFAILLPNTRKREAEVVRRRLLENITQENTRGKDIPYTATIGLGAAGPDTIGELMFQALDDLETRKTNKKSPD